jgi:hypothetical protein
LSNIFAITNQVIVGSTTQQASTNIKAVSFIIFSELIIHPALTVVHDANPDGKQNPIEVSQAIPNC